MTAALDSFKKKFKYYPNIEILSLYCNNYEAYMMLTNHITYITAVYYCHMDITLTHISG